MIPATYFFPVSEYSYMSIRHIVSTNVTLLGQVFALKCCFLLSLST